MRKYVLYAIGEIFLVVFGILIALQINNWNTHRLERIQENQLLQQLKEEFKDNKEQLQSKIDVRHQMNFAAFRLMEFAKSDENIKKRDSLDIYLFNTVFRPTFDPALGVTNELINSGKLYLIRNDDLRKALSDWSGKYIDELEEEELTVFEFIVKDYFPFLIKNYTLRNMFSNVQDSKLWTMVHLYRGQDVIDKVGNSSIIDDGSHLLNNPDFEDFMATLIAWNNSANNQSYGVIIKMEEILELIDRELTNH